MEFTEIARTCRDCLQAFTITAGEQRFMTERDLAIPTRCRPCRQARRNADQEPHGANRARPPFQAW